MPRSDLWGCSTLTSQPQTLSPSQFQVMHGGWHFHQNVPVTFHPAPRLSFPSASWAPLLWALPAHAPVERNPLAKFLSSLSLWPQVYHVPYLAATWCDNHLNLMVFKVFLYSRQTLDFRPNGLNCSTLSSWPAFSISSIFQGRLPCSSTGACLHLPSHILLMLAKSATEFISSYTPTMLDVCSGDY